MAENERWGTRIGLVLAMAGNAVGLGNFLRFPGQAAQNGGASFMIPYLICMVFLGFPLMWVAWTIGRRGGVLGHHTTPGMFGALARNPLFKYLGALGILLPFGVMIYYTYIESWTLGYAWHCVAGTFEGKPKLAEGFLADYTAGDGLWLAIGFFVITLAVNFYVLNRGISGGIEKVALFGMPALMLIAAGLAVYVNFFLEYPKAEGTASEGMGYLWNLDFGKFFSEDITNGGMWLAAAGQIFFTLSVGLGSIECYASYLRKKDDVTLSGLSTAATNEVCEVVIGGSLAVPAAAMFFGISTAVTFGTFGFGFSAFPAIFASMGGTGRIVGLLFFGLLFVAALTSSLAMGQPAVAFLQERFRMSRQKSVSIFAFVQCVCSIPLVYYAVPFVDEVDFWVGTFGLVWLALIEILLFNFVIGLNKSWESMHEGADLRVPNFFKPIFLIVSPLLILFVLGGFFVDLGTLRKGGTFAEAHANSDWAKRTSPFDGMAKQTVVLDGSRTSTAERVYLDPRSDDEKEQGAAIPPFDAVDAEGWIGAQVSVERSRHTATFAVIEGDPATGATKLPPTVDWVTPGASVMVTAGESIAEADAADVFTGTIAEMLNGSITWALPPKLSIRRLLSTPGNQVTIASTGGTGLFTFTTTVKSVDASQRALVLAEVIPADGEASLVPMTKEVTVRATPPKPRSLTYARGMLIGLLVLICIGIFMTGSYDRQVARSQGGQES